MSKVTLISGVFPDLLPMKDRSVGFHISDIIDRFSVESGLYDPSEGDQNLFELGSALEHAIKERMHWHDPRRYDTPRELEKDGIFGHCDLFDYLDWVVHEMKLTWKSVNNYEDGGSWAHLCQLMSYCYMTDSNVGLLHVAFIRGDYTLQKQVAYRKWKHEFTDAELRDNWRMVNVKAMQMEMEGFLDEKYADVDTVVKPKLGTADSETEKQTGRLLRMADKVNRNYKDKGVNVPQSLIDDVVQKIAA